ncbi:MAG: acetylglutamate kinase, partial [Candidatus Heimdallarchaeota archaeon]
MIIIKIGGADSINLEAIVRDIVTLQDQVIIVHGANAHRDKLLTHLNLEKKVITSLAGYSSVYSTREIIETMMMSYAGLINKKIVELCQRYGINAVGLSGLDGGLIRGKRNKGFRAEINGKKKIVRDLSGKPHEINYELLNLLISNGYTPVITMPILDEGGFAINSENDDVVVKLAA